MAKTPVTPPVSKPARHMGVELLRIVSTLMVIMLHTLGSTPILSSNMLNDKGAILWLFETLSYCAVNIFAITSGYVSCQSKFKFSRVMYLWLQVMFIFIVCTLAWGKIRPAELDEHAYRNMFFPLLADLNWYFTAFFGMTLFSPFMNILMKNMTKNQHKYLMAVIFVLFCIPTRIPEVSDLFQVGGGYSMIWLCAMYMIGGYIKIHGVPQRKNRYLWLMGYFVAGLIAWLYFIIVYDITIKNLGEAKFYKAMLSYTSPFMLIMAICMLEFFLTINFTKGSKFITSVSSLTFGIFVFHTQDLYWNLGLEESVNAIAKEPTAVVVFGVIGIVIATFIICGVATYLQMLLFKLVRLDKLCDIVHNKVFAKANRMLES